MTLLVGILATDGVVIAADRAVTFGNERLHTIADTQRKIEVVQGSVVVVGSGQVGMGQRFRASVAHAWDSKSFSDEPVQVGRVLAKTAREDFGATGAQQGQFGALVAYALKKPHLIEFAVRDMQPEAKTTECWYASMGSGQTLADPYLALMRRSIWARGQPNVSDATFAAYWVMAQAIAAAPGFIAEPIDMAVIRRKNAKEYEARLLGEDDIEEHRNRAESVTQQLGQALRGELAPPVEVPQSIPTPGTE